MAVKFNGKHLAKFIRPEEYEAIYPQVELAHKQLETKTGFGNDFLGWLDLPVTYDKEEFARIKAAADRSVRIPTCCWWRASAGPIWAPVPWWRPSVACTTMNWMTG